MNAEPATEQTQIVADTDAALAELMAELARFR
jgi:hypothetical protein